MRRIVLDSSDEDDSDEPVVRCKSKTVVFDSEEDNELEDEEDSDAAVEKALKPSNFDADIDPNKPENVDFYVLSSDEEDGGLNAGILVWDPKNAKPIPKPRCEKSPRKKQNKEPLQNIDTNTASPSRNHKSLLLLSESDSDVLLSSAKIPPANNIFSKSSQKNSLNPKPVPFAKCRDQLTSDLLADLNENVFDNKLSPKLEIVWYTRLNKTAGRALVKRTTDQQGKKDYQCTVQLSTKVVDSEDKLKHTLSHELCHVAVWAIDEADFKTVEPHGKEFKSWAKLVMQYRHDIKITTCHNYVIDYKWRWKCKNTQCGHIYGRHSKSIDPSRSRCGICKSEIELLTEDSNGRKSPTKGKRNAYSEFVSSEYAKLKVERPFWDQKQIMEVVRAEWKAKKEKDLKSSAPSKQGGEDNGVVQLIESLTL